MSLILNGTTVSDLVVNGVELSAAYLNGVQVYVGYPISADLMQYSYRMEYSDFVSVSQGISGSGNVLCCAAVGTDSGGGIVSFNIDDAGTSGETLFSKYDNGIKGTCGMFSPAGRSSGQPIGAQAFGNTGTSQMTVQVVSMRFNGGSQSLVTHQVKAYSSVTGMAVQAGDVLVKATPVFYSTGSGTPPLSMPSDNGLVFKTYKSAAQSYGSNLYMRIDVGYTRARSAFTWSPAFGNTSYIYGGVMCAVLR
jgi:hypothetical protein